MKMRYEILCQDCHFIYVREIVDCSDISYSRIAVDDFFEWKKGKLEIPKYNKPEWLGVC